jgi:hypothetical protein
MFVAAVAFLVVLHQASPTETVQHFLAAISSHDLNAAAKLVEGGKAPEVTAKMLSELPKFELKDPSEKVDGDKATVTGTVVVTPTEGKGETEPESANLKRINGAWLIAKVAQHTGQDVVGVFAYILSHPEALAVARGSAEKTVCLSNAKQLALGMIMYMGDNDDKFPKSAAKVHDAILPYTKNRTLWFCPDHPDMVAFTFNSQLLGKTSAQVEKPADTVMIYQGKDGKLDFADDGLCVIAFTDGHCKRFRKEQAATLRWKP